MAATTETDLKPTDLVVSRSLKAPPALVWKAWTDPEHIKQWWCPKPWTTPECEIDLRPGGAFRTVMAGPEGERFDVTGAFLEVVEQRRIVFTDTLEGGWRPAQNPFFTAIITMEPEGDGTKYTAVALHKDEADRKKHEDMGFHGGWGTVMEQLDDVAQSLKT